jgi:phosphoribosylformylglycinamidine synthase II
MQVTVDTAKELGILPEEFEKIKEILGRTPNFTELSIYSVMWSEHCSYKNSIIWLKKLPKDSPRMLAKAGEENAGLVDIGDGLACCFKIESHNHPSAIEPYQGAATGVGGINRDIFSMGARPVAQLNSLRFGKLESERTKWLLRGVVKGIGDYGNAFGIPTVGGEVYFEDCYHTNNLVNAMSVGIVEAGKTVSAVADGPGNPVYIFGAATGKDGIHGAAFASKDISEDSAEDLPSVQVGDPFWEKLILEASMEIIDSGAVVGMQDMGAAGITCSTSEMSAKSGTGMKIWLDKVPVRQENMKDWEILLSESQERMLVVLKKGQEKEAERIFEKWDLIYACIGEITDTGKVQYYMHGELVADIPAKSLVLGGGAPVYEREYTEPAYFARIAEYEPSLIPIPENLQEVARKLASLPNIASKKWIYEQYDSMVGTINQSTNDPSDAALVKIRNTDKSLALTVDCNSRFVYASPEQGTAIAVSEAARNIVCSGAEPVAVTNCLNFGNPYNPEVYYQFVGAIKGMKLACEALGTPVTGGNVSFYNQSTIDGTAVFPTPTIGMVGILESPRHRMTLSFKQEGDVILLVGPQTADIASSQYLVSWHGKSYSPAPYFDMDVEKAIQSAVLKSIRSGLVSSAHDVSEGGLFINLLESAFHKNKGFEIATPSGIRKDAFLFGEGQSRVVLTCKPTYAEALKDQLMAAGADVMEIGSVLGDSAQVDSENFGSISLYRDLYDNAIGKAMGS